MTTPPSTTCTLLTGTLADGVGSDRGAGGVFRGSGSGMRFCTWPGSTSGRTACAWADDISQSMSAIALDDRATNTRPWAAWQKGAVIRENKGMPTLATFK